MAGLLGFCGRSSDRRAVCDLPGRESVLRESWRREFSGRDDGGRLESRREDCGYFVRCCCCCGRGALGRDPGDRIAEALPSPAARQKSTCFLKLSTLATCTVSRSPSP